MSSVGGAGGSVRHIVKSDIVSIGPGISYAVGDRRRKKKPRREPELYIGGESTGFANPFCKGWGVVRQTRFRGLPINVEIDTGMEKQGVGPDGEPWRHVYKVPYGEIRKTEGADKDPVDIYLGPDPKSDKVFVVHQVKPDGKYDEDKCFLGFKTAKQAKKCYFEHGPKWGFGSIETMTFDQFKNGFLASNRREGFKKSVHVVTGVER
jgi:hypothetical protein